jgi:very-short-patch-repair endonuclease
MLHGPKDTQKQARTLRRTMSLPEVLLWCALRQRAGGFKFRRQHPAGPYVLDVFCASAQRAIEIDGEAHERGDRPGRDARRDDWLGARGVRVLRVPARAVLEDVEAVVAHIVPTCAGDSTDLASGDGLPLPERKDREDAP